MTKQKPTEPVQPSNLIKLLGRYGYHETDSDECLPHYMQIGVAMYAVGLETGHPHRYDRTVFNRIKRQHERQRARLANLRLDERPVPAFNRDRFERIAQDVAVYLSPRVRKGKRVWTFGGKNTARSIAAELRAAGHHDVLAAHVSRAFAIRDTN